MATLGSAVSDSFNIGVAEIRLGALANAGKLTQADSVGLIDDASFSMAQTQVDLKGGFPRKLVASAIVEQIGTVSMTLREYSRKNLSIMVGQGVPAAGTAFASTITADLAVDASSATVASTTGFTVGDIAVIYQDGKPETVSLVIITAKTSGSISFAANSLSMALLTSGGTINVYKANQVPLGAVSQVNYFSATLIQKHASGKPIVAAFWKVAIGGNMDYATNATDFASSKMELKVLEPTLSDVAVSGPLYTQAALIANNPFGLFTGGGAA